ncbi:MAG: serine protease [Chthoniobacteraceae bacterium]|nr:serine protease [Chthoniobacteraceae bacterium]
MVLLNLLVLLGVSARAQSAAAPSELQTLRADFEAQTKAVEAESEPRIQTIRLGYINALNVIKERLLSSKKVAESNAIAREITRVKEQREDEEGGRAIPGVARQLRSQFDLDIQSASSRSDLKLSSIRARYAQQLNNMARLIAARGDSEELRDVRFEINMMQVADLLAQKRIYKTPIIGDNPNGGRAEIKKNGLLAGFRIGAGGYNSETIIKSIQPVFRTVNGDVDGTVYGEGERHTIVVAKKGYAVGAVLLKPGSRLIGMQVTFMKIKDQGLGLDPRDSYKSEWVGGTTGGKPKELNGEGKLVVGSNILAGADVDAIGLIFLQ